MKRILIILVLICSTPVFSQSSDKYNSEFENFYRAEDLFEKEQYAAARKEFSVFTVSYTHLTLPTN